MSATEINANQMCSVTLRKRGVIAINGHYLALGMVPPKTYKVGDSYEGALWEIMLIFGSSCFMGPEPPFETALSIKEL